MQIATVSHTLSRVHRPSAVHLQIPPSPQVRLKTFLLEPLWSHPTGFLGDVSSTRVAAVSIPHSKNHCWLYDGILQQQKAILILGAGPTELWLTSEYSAWKCWEPYHSPLLKHTAAFLYPLLWFKLKQSFSEVYRSSRQLGGGNSCHFGML